MNLYEAVYEKIVDFKTLTGRTPKYVYLGKIEFEALIRYMDLHFGVCLTYKVKDAFFCGCEIIFVPRKLTHLEVGGLRDVA